MSLTLKEQEFKEYVKIPLWEWATGWCGFVVCTQKDGPFRYLNDK